MSIYREEEYSKRFDLDLWKKLFQFARPYKRHFMGLAVVMIAVASIDTVFPLLTKYVIDHFIIPGTLEGLGKFVILYLVLISIQALNVWSLIALAGKIDMWISYDIRCKGFQHLQELSFSYYDTTPVGWMMARMTSDIRRLADVLAWGVVDSVWGVTMMIAIMITMLLLNWRLALVTLTVVPLLLVISLFFQQKILKAQRRVRKINSRITASFNEGIGGAKTTKTLVREAENLQEFQEETGAMFRSSVQAAVLASLYLPSVLTLASIGTGLALWYGGQQVLLARISYGTLVAFLSYTVLFFDPIRDLARVFAELQSAQASAERIFSMLSTRPEITDRPEVVARYGDVYQPKPESWPEIQGSISFKNVFFAYKEGEHVLSDFNLEVKAGEKIALVGETGAGKSTIVNLACRFFEPSAGQILIDGIDYRDRSLVWLQSHLGYVLQTPHLFSGTVKENIRYGRLEATDEEIVNAAQLVNAHEFIMKMEQGYDTEVGEGGNRLSTGEKQLISFARAILANPRIFVLDEATSSVDTETEQKIQHAIHHVLKDRTSFIIAHRLSTIREADRILVIRRGKLTEQGSHHELLKQKGYYYRLYTNQFMEEHETQVLRAA
ncbi:MAG: ABC transporter ATP-binding protein [Candidatus Vecturithrix sp.]|jgi:ATP-binding cassette subfamily B protein|nr:ABC transporter ATP-binding protein [Candidatus Vecturithrix sp.]